MSRFSFSTQEALDAGTPIPFGGRLSTSSSTYATVVSWTVGTGVEGDLRELAMFADILASTEWRVTIGGTVRITGRVFPSAVSFQFANNRLAAAAVVLIEARSPDNVTAIVADGTIAGVER